jgi:hypothetical protein
MKYTQGKMGRIFVVKIEHGDDLLKELKHLTQLENISAGVFYVIGAIKETSLVTGPKECTCPPVPVWSKFDDCREILGIGTLFRENDDSTIHLHGVTGREDKTLMGCIRGETEVYLVAEVIIIELVNTCALREFDEKLGVKVLNVLAG